MTLTKEQVNELVEGYYKRSPSADELIAFFDGLHAMLALINESNINELQREVL